jgi:hypothetical protein
MASPPCPLHVCFVCLQQYVRIPDTARYAAGAQHAMQTHKDRLLSVVCHLRALLAMLLVDASSLLIPPVQKP